VKDRKINGISPLNLKMYLTSTYIQGRGRRGDLKPTRVREFNNTKQIVLYISVSVHTKREREQIPHSNLGKRPKLCVHDFVER